MKSRVRSVWRVVAGWLRSAGFALRRRIGKAPAPPIGPPVFIVGCGHSGTTLLLSILSVHSRLHAVPYESSMMERSAVESDWFVRQFNRDAREAGRARWVEKTPRHIVAIGRILALFPDARVLLMLRDGRDVICSLRDRSQDLEGSIARWVDDNAAAEPYFDHPAVLVVRYEDLVAGQESELRRILGFLDEPFEPALLQHHTSGFRFYGRYERADRFAERIDRLEEPPATVTGSDHRLYRSWQARQPVFDGSGRWQSDLSDADKQLVKRRAGDRLIAYGYAEDERW